MSRLVRPFLAALLIAVAPAAAQPADPGPDAAVEAASPAPPDAIRYRLVVDSPNPPRDALEEALDLARWQADDGMTLDLLERLAKEAVPQAREIAAVQGFFDAEASIAIDRQSSPVVVTLTVRPGRPARVRGVDVQVGGPAASDAPLGTAAIEEARDGWSLPLGALFRQQDWNDAKAGALRALHRAPYPAARIVGSEARVDPETASAELSVRIDSGPRFRFGGLAVQGLKRYPPELVTHFSTIRPGDPYTQEALDQYVRRLSASGYFSSVQASVDARTADPDDATVDVSVIEGPTHRLEGALAFSTDTGFGARGTYTNVNVDERATQMRIEARLETREQLLSTTFRRPPTARGWIDEFAVGVRREDIENTVESTASVQVERRGVDERRTPVFTAGVYADRQEPAGAEETTAYATFVQAGYVLRRVDDLLSPTRGYMLDGRIGAGIPGLSTRGFGRLYGQAAAWYPIDRLTQLVFRGEAGAVLASNREDIPSVFLFRTGGDTSVRGYAYRSLGVPLGDAVVGGRYLVVASAEAVRWINETWGVAVFVDAGDAADSVDDLDPAVGVGIGARLRTPVGPFRLDVAYGERTQDVRIHFSVGVTF